MGEKTGIKWTDLLFRVNRFVAFPTQRQAVAYFKSKFWIFGEVFNMMSDKVAAFIIATVLTGECVSTKNVITPIRISSRESLSFSFFRFAVFIRMIIRAAFCVLSSLYAHFDARFYCMSFTEPVLGYAFSFFAHSQLSFRGVLFPFECRDSAFVTLFYFNPSTGKATTKTSIMPGSIYSEIVNFKPQFALIAPLKTGLDFLNNILNRYTYFIRE